MSEKTQRIFRAAGKNRAYTKLCNAFLQNRKLRLDTLGLIAALLSRPTDWRVTFESTKTQMGLGKKKLRTIINEAKKHGYMEVVRERTADGAVECIVYYVSDNPDELKDEIAKLDSLGHKMPETGQVDDECSTDVHVEQDGNTQENPLLAENGEGCNNLPLEQLVAGTTSCKKGPIQKKDLDTKERKKRERTRSLVRELIELKKLSVWELHVVDHLIGPLLAEGIQLKKKTHDAEFFVLIIDRFKHFSVQNLKHAACAIVTTQIWWPSTKEIIDTLPSGTRWVEITFGTHEGNAWVAREQALGGEGAESAIRFFEKIGNTKVSEGILADALRVYSESNSASTEVAA